MKTLRIRLLILVLFISGSNIFCQKVFREGFIIKKTGETLNGLVEYSPNKDVPSVCVFKRFDIATIVNYFAGDIIAFGYKNGNRFESFNLAGKSSFYEVIITGDITLYRKRSKYFLTKNQSDPVELKNGPVTWISEGEKKEFKEITGFLEFITEGKAGEIPSKFEFKNDIIPLISAYNSVSGKDYYIFNRTLTEKQLAQQSLVSGSVKNRFGIVTGINLYMLDIIPVARSYFPDPENEAAVISGLTYERSLSRKTDRISLRTDFLFLRQTFYCYEENTLANGSMERDDAFFDFSAIKIPIMLQYSFTGRMIIPFVYAGFGYQYFLNNNYLRIQETETPGHEITTEEYRNMQFNRDEFSAVGGVGLRTRLYNNIHFYIQGRIELGTGIFVPKVRGQTLYKQKSIQPTLLVGISF